jgi:outer membrane murein-binding lipoprotein Lpp
MKTTCSREGRILSVVLFIGSHLLLAGCSDDSKTSGTVVEVSEEAKQALQSRKEAYKAKAKAPDLKSKQIKTH